jgi:cyclophilin family peptidyl-prolyl cis-trans isomerase
MKFDRRTLIIASVLVVLVIFGLQKNRATNLPSGQVTEIGQISLNDTSPEPFTDRPLIEISTPKGVFTLELRPDISPEAALNFLNKWSVGYCNGTVFHRVEDWVVQGCDPKGDGTGGESTLKTENSTESFLAGSAGVARKSYPVDLSNDSQFFIVKKDSVFLDGEYSYLGRVISGMDVVNRLVPGDAILSTTILTK